MSERTLVERLRANAQGISLGAEGMGWGPEDLYAAAADEIERLSQGRALETTPLADSLRECWGRLDPENPDPSLIIQASTLLAMAAHALDLRKEHADIAVEAFNDSIKVNALVQSRLEAEIDRLRGILATAVNLLKEGSPQEAKRRLQLALLDVQKGTLPPTVINDA
jgi:hypothetical protein